MNETLKIYFSFPKTPISGTFVNIFFDSFRLDLYKTNNKNMTVPYFTLKHEIH